MFHDMTTRYWTSATDCDATLNALSKEIFFWWSGLDAEEGDNEEDSAEYCEQVYEQLRIATKAML